MRFFWLHIRRFFASFVGHSKRFDRSKNQTRETLSETSPFPESSLEAHTRLHEILGHGVSIRELSHEEFLKGWVAMAYIAPGLNPDEAKTEDGGWPPGWRPIAEEAFRRFSTKKLTKEELYPKPIRSL